jgi:hypothetical protein
MPYVAPKPTVANVLATAAVWSGSGDTSGALRLLNAHGLTVADMRSYLISKRGLLNGLGSPMPNVVRVPDPRRQFQPRIAALADLYAEQAMGRFHFHASNPIHAAAAIVKKATAPVASAAMMPMQMAASLASRPAAVPVAPPLASPAVAAQVQSQAQPAAQVQPAAPVYPVSNLPPAADPNANAPLPSSSDGSTGDNSGGGDTGYQDAASVFNGLGRGGGGGGGHGGGGHWGGGRGWGGGFIGVDGGTLFVQNVFPVAPCYDARGRVIPCPTGVAGLGRFKHYAPRGARSLRHNAVVAGLSALPASPADPSIQTQLSQISVDWPSGTLHIGPNKYSILTTLIGGLIVKGLMWGLSKGGGALAGSKVAAGRKAR